MRNNVYYGMRVSDRDDRLVGMKMSPDNTGNFCYDPAEDCALIVERRVTVYHWKRDTEIKTSLRVLTGSGASGEKVGTEIGWITDNGLGHRNDYVGRYKIVGIIEPGGVRSGIIPTRKLPHYVMK